MSQPGNGPEWTTQAQIDPEAADPTRPEVTNPDSPDFVVASDEVTAMEVDPLPFVSDDATESVTVPTESSSEVSSELTPEFSDGETAPKDTSEDTGTAEESRGDQVPDGGEAIASIAEDES